MTDTTPSLHTEAVSVPRARQSGEPMQAFLAISDGTGPFPGVVVIHEIFGLNENIRDIAERIANEGYAALAVDLFSNANRVICMMRIFYGLLIRPLKNGVVGDLQAALDYLGALPEVDPKRLGAIGFCMGGSYALQLACTVDGLRAASVFYGQNPRPLEAVSRACPIVGSYPERDFTANAARKLEPMLEQYQVPYDIKIYPDARHSFFNDQGSAYQAEAATDAWGRTLSFFNTYLRISDPAT
ncbi:MAG: dienelactone hydrolase family protein [Anaerolineales bacterium]